MEHEFIGQIAMVNFVPKTAKFILIIFVLLQSSALELLAGWSMVIFEDSHHYMLTLSENESSQLVDQSDHSKTSHCSKLKEKKTNNCSGCSSCGHCACGLLLFSYSKFFKSTPNYGPLLPLSLTDFSTFPSHSYPPYRPPIV